MVLVRSVFHAKMGRASKVVATMKKMAAQFQSPAAGARHMRILTDLSGRYDTVVQELEYDTIDAFLQDLAKMSSAPDVDANSEEWLELVEGGVQGVLHHRVRAVPAVIGAAHG